MAKKQESIKEYGVDLEKQYKDAEKKLVVINNKIRKRAIFLIKQCPDFELEEGKPIKHLLNWIDEFSGELLLDMIKKVEADYVSKTQQTDLFNGQKTF